MKKILVSVTLGLILVGCAPGAEQAKEQIEKSGYQFSSEGLSTAIMSENQEVKELFLKSDYPPEKILMVAVAEEDSELVKQVINQKQVNVNADEGNILLQAVKTLELETVKLLLDKGADPNLQPCLAQAARMGDLEIVRLLLDRGAKVNDQPTGSLPLVYAVLRERQEIVEFLLSKGANPNSKVKFFNGIYTTTVDFGKLGDRILTTKEIKALLNEYRKKV